MNAPGDDPAEVRSDIESLRRIWALAGPLRGKVAAGIAFRFAQSMCLGFAFGVMVWVVTGIADGRALTIAAVWQVAALMALSLAGQLLFGYLSVSRSWLSSFELAGELRLSILDRLRRLPMGFHLSRHTGDTVTVLTTDMQMLESFMSDALPRIAQAFGLPVAVALFLAWRDWVVALAVVSSIVLATPIFLWSSRKLGRLGIRRQDMQAEAAGRMIEYVKGIAVIRAFNRTVEGQENFRAALQAFRDISVRMVVQLTAPLVLFGAVIMLGVPLVLVVAGDRFFSGAIDQATLIAALVLLFSAYTPLLALVSVMELTRIADASLTRIDRVLSAEQLPEPHAPADPRGFAIGFEKVGFGYDPRRRVLEDISFHVPERTMTAVVGASGSGKSTILKLLPRFWDVGTGRITIGGVDVREISEEKLNQLITVVFQDVYLFAGSIFDNIAYGRIGASEAEVEAAARAAQAHAFIAALPGGYRTRIGEGGATLSGGERQRISIARAILKDAPIVLLDEATSAIDATNERAMQEALAKLVANKTLIVVAHKLSTIQAADQIVVLKNGSIAERGDHHALMQRAGPYRRLWESRIRAAGWKIGRDHDSTVST
ncbi:Vitamin B12 import ATP-binding protein BtuD [Mycolicibacterium aubagnense]